MKSPVVGRDVEDPRLLVGVDRHILGQRRRVDRERLGDRQLRAAEVDRLARSCSAANVIVSAPPWRSPANRLAERKLTAA